jgi:hypothetical protein
VVVDSAARSSVGFSAAPPACGCTIICLVGLVLQLTARLLNPAMVPVRVAQVATRLSQDKTPTTPVPAATSAALILVAVAAEATLEVAEILVVAETRGAVAISRTPTGDS